MEKRLYTIQELSKMGYSAYDLRMDCRIQGQTFATRRTAKRGSNWRVDLQKYEEFLQKRALEQQKEMRYISTL
ncbi:MAG: hypothetical protein MR487_05955 [Lachnospiraceae bacterium]|nr:hypothetical protein [Lachnospiraceae bacterium]